MAKSVVYKGIRLMQGSEAYTLFTEKKEGWQKKLDFHLKELDNKEKELLKRYGGKE